MDNLNELIGTFLAYGWDRECEEIDFLREVQGAMLNSAELVDVGMKAYPMEELDRAVYVRMIATLRRLAGERPNAET